jgi:hypothetical protein
MDSDMSHTKRTPIARQPALQFSIKALALFEALERATRQRNAANCIPDDSGSGSGYCKFECAACRTWNALDVELNDELHLKPWQGWPCVPQNPFPPGSKQARNWRPHPDSEQSVRWRQLDEASRARRQPPATDTA